MGSRTGRLLKKWNLFTFIGCPHMCVRRSAGHLPCATFSVGLYFKTCQREKKKKKTKKKIKKEKTYFEDYFHLYNAILYGFTSVKWRHGEIFTNLRIVYLFIYLVHKQMILSLNYCAPYFHF